MEAFRPLQAVPFFQRGGGGCVGCGWRFNRCQRPAPGHFGTILAARRRRKGQGLRAADPMAAAAAARELLGFWGVAVRGGFVAAECAYGSFPNQGMNTGGDGVGTA
eukprot:GGOE01031483.1.p7 GENE.GGOE01031483.1~~GGOE01031483.1.p7  ORF type:complete len:106 (-),score=6.85 GGOE01031483.1:575-892(-)